MQKLLVPVLLATIALSSSKVLPILSMNELNTEPHGFDSQQNDNTFSNKYRHRHNLNAILLNINFEPEIQKISPINYFDEDNKDLDGISKNDNYNVKVFRKEQWHNYPRQLDRLNRYFYDHSTDKRNLDPDDPGNGYTDGTLESHDDLTSNEYEEKYPETRKINKEAEVAAAVINPLLIFRIHLACLNKDTAVDRLPRLLETSDLEIDKLKEAYKEYDRISNEVNPAPNLIKVKREGKASLGDAESVREYADGIHLPFLYAFTYSNYGSSLEKPSKSRMMNKRIFSLWSRLQSLNHKGHELHHRRHLYALYGLPESEEGGVLTAETRATFMRPPGSPLRWG